MDRFKLIAKEKINELPKTSGVYCFTEKKADIGSPLIYIGKAINIQSRVKNHFNQPSYRDNLFIDKVDKIGYFETDSEIEALVLEANLIKKYQPKFNVIWRDDKNYFYVAIAQNENKIPYVFITHQPHSRTVIPLEKGIQGLDPRFRGDDIFIGPFVEGTALKKTLRFLRRAFPYYTVKKHQKIKCTYCHLGLCPGPQPDLAEYRRNIKRLMLILQGKRGAVLRALRKEMKNLSGASKFEEAAKVRDTISNLQQVMSHTHVINSGKDSVRFLPLGKNPTISLAKIIGLEKPISKIECYDVSNIQGKFATGSMVVFVDGAPDKSQYKKFKIKMENKPNDIAMLKEIINRRLNHSEWKYPDAILIDGGKAQLNIAIKSKLQNPNYKKNSNFKILSIAKGRQELFIERPKGYPEKPIPLKSLPQEVYNLIKNLDDEAHRFAITYHKKLRKKSLLQ
jgi:excinuclease ABC subunit C